MPLPVLFRLSPKLYTQKKVYQICVMMVFYGRLSVLADKFFFMIAWSSEIPFYGIAQCRRICCKMEFILISNDN